LSLERIRGVLCCGNISYDIPVWPVDRFNWGTTLWVDSIEHSVGGNGGNTSYTLGCLGTPVRLYGMTGSDEEGAKVLRVLESIGVDTSGVGRCEGPSNSSICIVHPNADRLFLHRLGASSQLAPEDIAIESAPEQYSHFHLANLYALPKVRVAAASVLERARASGRTTSVDTAWDAKGLWFQELGPCLPFTDLLFVNESEARMLSGSEDPDEACAFFRSHGATQVVVKLGAQGCIVYDGSNRHAIAGFEVKAKDTTGAGDCFAGAFLAALARGYSWREAGRVANAVGAMKVEQLGAVAGVRNFDETLAWMATRGASES
jgi:ribokinase